MKNSSAAEVESETPTSVREAAKASTVIDEIGSAPIPTGTTETDDFSTGSLKAPNFGDSPNLSAMSAKVAGRINASKISPKEQEALLGERQKLLDRQFAGTMTRQESNRLEYVRWTLDRIADATNGESLDLLEAAVAQYEKFAGDLTGLNENLERLLVDETEQQRQRMKQRYRR